MTWKITCTDRDNFHESWWRHQMEAFSTVTGPLCGEFTWHRWIPWQRPVTRSFDVFFHLRLNRRLSKQSRRRWFETPSRLSWRHCNVQCQDYAVTVMIHSVSWEEIRRSKPDKKPHNKIQSFITKYELLRSRHVEHNNISGNASMISWNEFR